MAAIKHFAAPAGLTTPPLSFATRVGDLLFVSGIPGFDDSGTLPDGFEAQFGFVVKNIKRVLDEAGATFRDLVKVNVLLTRASDVADDERIIRRRFRTTALSRPYHLRGPGSAKSEDADRDRGRGVAGGTVGRISESVIQHFRPVHQSRTVGCGLRLTHAPARACDTCDCQRTIRDVST